MKRYILLALFLLTLLPLTPLSAADECLPIDNSLSPDFTYETPDGTPNFDNLIPQVTAYLNAGGDADALPDFFAGVEGDESRLLESMSSQDLHLNVDDDDTLEILVSVAIVHNAVYGGGLLLYDCQNGAYALIGRTDLENNSYRDWGFAIFPFANRMQNDQSEILIGSDVGFSFNLYQVLFWDGEGFAAVMWETHYDDEPRSAMVATDFEARDLGADGIPEVQLIFGPDGSARAYAYVDVYQIRDEGFHFTCQIYKGEEPTFADPDALYAIEAVEEADSAFRCGYDNIAEVLFRQVVEDDSLAIFEFDAAPSFFERENLRAFSLYRLVLLNARRGDVDAAASAYEELQAEFPVEVPGSNYTSMAEAFWLEYEQSADWDAACHALADYLEPTVTAILEDETRFARALYLSPIAGYPGHRPNALIRACPDDDLNLGLPDPAIPGMR